jgi:hypothetical protein
MSAMQSTLTGSFLVRLVIGLASGEVLVWLLFGPDSRTQIAASIVVLSLILGTLLSDASQGRFRLWNIKYYVLASYGVFLGAGMLLDVLDDTYVFNLWAIGITLLGLGLFLLGFFWRDRAPLGRAPHRLSFELTPDQLFFAAVALYLIGFGFLYAEWHLYGQLQSYSGQVVSSRGIPTPPLPLVHTFAELAGSAALLTLVLIRRGCTMFQRVPLTILFAATIVWYVVWGARGNFLSLSIGWLIIWSEVPNSRGKRKTGLTPFVAFCSSALIMLGLSLVRTDWGLAKARSAGLGRLKEAVILSLDIFRELRRTIDFFPAHMDYLSGYSFYGIVVNVVPRSWWWQKPIGVGKLASILYDHNPNSSIALSLPGELYANFGTLGSAVGMLLFGLLAGMAYRWYAGRRGEPCALVVYIQLVLAAMGIVRGDILDAVGPLLYHLLPVATLFFGLTTLNRLFAREGLRRTVMQAWPGGSTDNLSVRLGRPMDFNARPPSTV